MRYNIRRWLEADESEVRFLLEESDRFYVHANWCWASNNIYCK